MRVALPAILSILIGPAIAAAQPPPPLFVGEPALFAAEPAAVFRVAPPAAAPVDVAPPVVSSPPAEIVAAAPPFPTRVDPSDDDRNPPHDHAGHSHGHSHAEPGHAGHAHDDPFGIRSHVQGGHDHGSHDQGGHGHGGHGHGGHDHGGHGGFDYIRPFENHNRGTFEAHGHAGHTSIEGYPFVHGIRTEIDFVERALEFDLVRNNGVDDGAASETEFESELVWAFNSRMIFLFGTPLISRDPLVGSHTAGVGDLHLGFQFLAYGGENSLLFTALNLGVPTGNAARDLGAGHLSLEPTLFYLYDFREGTYIQSRFGWETPVSATDVGSEFGYDIALFHTFLATREWRAFRFFTPIVELNGLTQLNEDGYGRTTIDFTGGVRWVVRGADEIGIGGSIPVSGARDLDSQFRVSYRVHF